MSQTPEFPSGKLFKLLAESAQRSSSLHGQFLQQRWNALKDIQTLIGLQIQHAGANGTAQPVRIDQRPALFNSQQLDAFGTGLMSQCLGPAFAAYDHRRVPRIPNGELKMMSRVVEIEGEPRNFSRTASIRVEYDVPPTAWYLRDAAFPEMPCSVYMETALQPCGFLSAYLDTYAFVPHTDAFFFRNLDGSARLVNRVDVRGQTITTRARLLSSVNSGGTVIQKFAFELTCTGKTIFQGESTFGYFSPETMANQVGLDGGKTTQPLFHAGAGAALAGEMIPTQKWQSGHDYLRLSRGWMNFLDEVFVSRSGGRFGQGYVYASRPVNGQDWFYPYHFYQDPVMPGSLGVEAIIQAMQVYALETGLGRGLSSPRFGTSTGKPMQWRYRGQITPQHRLMELEVHLNAPEQTAGSLSLTGDASLWVDGLRIYEVKNASLAILEG